MERREIIHQVSAISTVSHAALLTGALAIASAQELRNRLKDERGLVPSHFREAVRGYANMMHDAMGRQHTL